MRIDHLCYRLRVSQGASVEKAADPRLPSHHTPFSSDSVWLTLCGSSKDRRCLLWASSCLCSTLPLWSQIWTYNYLFYFRLTFKIKRHLQSQVRAESYPVETIQDIFIIKETKVSSHTKYFLTRRYLGHLHPGLPPLPPTQALTYHLGQKIEPNYSINNHYESKPKNKVVEMVYKGNTKWKLILTATKICVCICVCVRFPQPHSLTVI